MADTNRPVYEIAAELLGAASLKSILAIVANDDAVLGRLELLGAEAKKELDKLGEEIARLVSDKQAAFDRHMAARESACKAREDALARAETEFERVKINVENDRQYIARLKSEIVAKERTLAHVPLPDQMHVFDVMLKPPGKGKKPDIFT